MDIFDTPIFSKIGKVKDNIAQISDSAPSTWQSADIYFNWINNDFPYEHTHKHWELFIVIEGQVIHRINKTKVNVGRGDAWLIRPEDKHSLTLQSSKEKTSHINFVLRNEYLETFLNSISPELYTSFLNSKKPLRFKIPELALNTFVHSALSIQRFVPEALTENIIKCKLLFMNIINYLLSDWFILKNTFPVWLEKLFVEINKPRGYQKSVEEIVSLTPYSYSRLAHLFKEHVGMSIKQYLTIIKMNAATELLSSSKLTILQISEELGYNNLSNFNHTFKKFFNMPPTQFKKAAMKKNNVRSF